MRRCAAPACGMRKQTMIAVGKTSLIRSRKCIFSMASIRRIAGFIFALTGSRSVDAGKKCRNLPDHMDVIDNATADKPFRLVAAPARTFLNSSFTETPSSVKREQRPTALVHPDDCIALGVTKDDRVELGNERGMVIVHVKPQDGQQRGVVIVEGIWPNKYFENGIGINAITSADPGWPKGGAAFHDTAVWIKRIE